MNDKIKAYRDRYITGYEYTRAAQAIKSDLDFLSELVDRNKTSDFDFEVTPTKNTIHGYFLKALWRAVPHCTEQNIQEYLIIYNVTVGIVDRLDWHDLDVSELLDWANNISYYYEFDILHNVSSLIGGSGQCETLDEAINKHL